MNIPLLRFLKVTVHTNPRHFVKCLTLLHIVTAQLSFYLFGFKKPYYFEKHFNNKEKRKPETIFYFTNIVSGIHFILLFLYLHIFLVTCFSCQSCFILFCCFFWYCKDCFLGNIYKCLFLDGWYFISLKCNCSYF